MRYIKLRYIAFPGMLLFLALTAKGNDYVAVNEQLGSYLPENLVFTDSDGMQVLLTDLIDRPTVITPVYYNCPGLCTPIMDGLVKLLHRTELELGEDFQIVNISFHEQENTELARMKKRNYMGLLEDLQAEKSMDHWHFMTGDRENIDLLLGTIGYSVIRKGEDIFHPASIMIVSPNNKIIKYIHGTSFNPVEFRMAILNAGEEKTMATISKMMKACFNYEPAGRDKQKFTTIIGFILMLSIAVVLIVAYPPLRNKT